MMRRFDGMRALVTGAAHGIGASTCRRLADEGAAVFVADIDSAAAAQLANEFGPAATATATDVGDPTACSELARGFADGGDGGLDVLVNNAFTVTINPAGQLAAADWEREIDLNLSGVYHGVHALLPLLHRSRGAVVNVSSVHAVVGYPGHPGYAAAKGGGTPLTRQLCADYTTAVGFHAVLPGAIHTRIWNNVSETDKTHHAARAAEKRLGTPEEMATAIAFLSSEDASYITGACLAVDGGLTSCWY